MNMKERLEVVRSAVAQATAGLTGQDYRDFMDQLLSDAEGWRMELEEMEGEGDAK
jgi:DNA-binding ferritin-like protein (Dps family)